MDAEVTDMVHTTLPKVSWDRSATGCCPPFDPAGWDEQEFEFCEWLFVRATTVNFLHIPLNMGSMMKRTWAKIQQAAAAPQDSYLVLSTDPSPWRGEHYFLVTRDVPNAQMVRLSGRHRTKAFEGPYRDAGKWAREMERYVQSQGESLQTLYFFYTTCPRCAKVYGKNYVVAFAAV
jgi:hypothetical protein